MKTRIIFAAGFLLVCNFAPLSAQFSKSEFGIGALVGGSKLIGDIENTNLGLTSGLMIRYMPIPRFGITMTGTYGQMTSGLNAIKTNILSASLLGTAFLMPENYFRPFVSLGLSRFHYTTRDGNGELLSRGDGSPIEAWKGSLQFGIGFELFTGKTWAINTMGNYNITLVDDLDAVDQGGKDGFFNGFLGLVHYFKTNNKPKYEQRWQEHDNALITEKVDEPQEAPASTAEQFANGIYFERGTATLLPQSKKQLHNIYRYLYGHPSEDLELLGVSGSNRSENKLVEERAKAVKSYLINLGIEADRIIVKTDVRK
ncbi:MAG: OmpA family protein [bacterium]